MTRKGWLLFAAISVLWGIPYLFVRIAVQEVDPTVVTFAQVAIAAAVLLPVAAQRKMLRQVSKKWLIISMLAFVQVIGPILLISYGEQRIASSLTSLLITAEPLLVALLALRFDPSERVNGLRLIGLILGMGGSWRYWASTRAEMGKNCSVQRWSYWLLWAMHPGPCSLSGPQSVRCLPSAL